MGTNINTNLNLKIGIHNIFKYIFGHNTLCKLLYQITLTLYLTPKFTLYHIFYSEYKQETPYCLSCAIYEHNVALQQEPDTSLTLMELEETTQLYCLGIRCMYCCLHQLHNDTISPAIIKYFPKRSLSQSSISSIGIYLSRQRHWVNEYTRRWPRP